MNTESELLLTLLCGMVLGLIGQGIRVVVGLSKQSGESAASGRTLAEDFDGRRLMVSLLIGAIAGALAMLLEQGLMPLPSITDAGTASQLKTIVMGIIAAGYAGTDFIEGVFSRLKLPYPQDVGNRPAIVNDRVLAQRIVPKRSLTPLPEPVAVAANRLWEKHKNDCNDFVRAVCQAENVPMTGTADEIVNTLLGGGSWRVLNDGAEAAGAAQNGTLVLGGLRSDELASPIGEPNKEHGHVVVVTGPMEGGYPLAYWGTLHGPANPLHPGRNDGVNWAFARSDRDRVHYAQYVG